MPGIMPESDSEDELPPAWEERATRDGYVYYMNHQTKTTQWTHPRTGKSKQVAGSLPPGWRAELDAETQRTLFVDAAERRTFADPRLAFAVEDRPQSLAEVRQRFDGSTTALQVLHGQDLGGRVALVTGGNTGIGYETVRSLAMHGCSVVLACRRPEAGDEAVSRLAAEHPVAASLVRVRHVDLADMRTVRRFVEAMRLEFEQIDMLILNAGNFAMPFTRTADGLEATFQVCHLAHHYIATRLSDRLSTGARVVVLASESHRFGTLPANGVDLTEDQLSPGSGQKYWYMQAYNNAKLCNVLFARELGRRWQDRGVATYSVHPGNMVSTDLSRHWWLFRWLFAVVRPFTKSLQQAAATTIYCASAPELTGMSGQYYNNCYFCEPSKRSQSEPLAVALWDLTELMIARIFQTERARESTE